MTYRCRVKKDCPWASGWSGKARLVHEFQHYGWSERIARESVQRLTVLANSVNKGNGWRVTER